MSISYQKLRNGAVMIRIMTLAKNFDFQACDSFSKRYSILKIK